MTTLLKQVCWKLNLHHNWIRPVTRLIRFITFFWARFSVILSKTKLISLLFLLSFDDEKPTDGERLDHFRNNMHLMSKSGIIRSIVFSRSMIFSAYGSHREWKGEKKCRAMSCLNTFSPFVLRCGWFFGLAFRFSVVVEKVKKNKGNKMVRTKKDTPVCIPDVPYSYYETQLKAKPLPFLSRFLSVSSHRMMSQKHYPYYPTSTL